MNFFLGAIFMSNSLLGMFGGVGGGGGGGGGGDSGIFLHSISEKNFF